MAYEGKVKQINLQDASNRKKWGTLLSEFDITIPDKQTLLQISCFGIFEKQRLIATGSFHNNVLKYIAVDPTCQDGKLFNLIVSTLINELAQRQIFHVFVFTKAIYQNSFEHVGFKTLAKADTAVLLETGDYSVHDFIKTLPTMENQSDKQVSAIVMNANPFTLGHRYLVETAAAQSDLVYVFVVEQDASLFTTKTRFELVRQGLADLSNVIVRLGNEYMVSYMTFPSYFITGSDNVIKYQTAMDAELFKTQIAKPLNIKTRYLGSEPFSKTTSIYNKALSEVLPPEVKVKIIPRKQIDGNVISATQVRRAIKNNAIEQIKDYLPATTYEYIIRHLNDLQKLIKEGFKIDGN